MEGETVTSVTWEGYAHHYEEKDADWYWIVGIITVSLAAAVMLFGNVLLSVLILVAGGVVLLLAARGVQMIPYAVTTRGIRIDERLYPYSTLESFFLDEEVEVDPVLLVKSQRWFMPLLVIPIPLEYVDEIELLLSSKLPEEPMEEPILHRFLEILGL